MLLQRLSRVSSSSSQILIVHFTRVNRLSYSPFWRVSFNHAARVRQEIKYSVLTHARWNPSWNSFLLFLFPDFPLLILSFLPSVRSSVNSISSLKAVTKVVCFLNRRYSACVTAKSCGQTKTTTTTAAAAHVSCCCYFLPASSRKKINFPPFNGLCSTLGALSQNRLKTCCTVPHVISLTINRVYATMPTINVVLKSDENRRF